MRRIFLRPILLAIAMTAPIWLAAASAGTPVREVQVVAKRFSFEPAVIEVTAGEPVRLVIRSADTVHGFAIRKLKIDVQVPAHGETVTAEFTAPPPGRYEIVCSEFCGSGHGQMKTALVSVAPTRPAR
jgi:cytochrome c oxidase subunit II